MRHTIHFNNGDALEVDEAVVEKITSQANDIQWLVVTGYIINLHAVNYISAQEGEPATPGAVAHTPRPQDLRDNKKAEEERIKSDPSAILKRTQEKYEPGA